MVQVWRGGDRLVAGDTQGRSWAKLCAKSRYQKDHPRTQKRAENHGEKKRLFAVLRTFQVCSEAEYGEQYHGNIDHNPKTK